MKKVRPTLLFTLLFALLLPKESLRKFTREELRDKVNEHFKRDAANTVLWQKITTQEQNGYNN